MKELALCSVRRRRRTASLSTRAAFVEASPPTREKWLMSWRIVTTKRSRYGLYCSSQTATFRGRRLMPPQQQFLHARHDEQGDSSPVVAASSSSSRFSSSPSDEDSFASSS